MSFSYLSAALHYSGIRDKENDLADMILNKKYLIQDDVFDKTFTTIFDSEAQEDLAVATTHLQRIAAIEPYFDNDMIQKILAPYSYVFNKNVKIAQKLLSKGKRFENEKELKKALDCYKLAHCFAPPHCWVLSSGDMERCLLTMDQNQDPVNHGNVNQIAEGPSRGMDDNERNRLSPIYQKYRDEVMFRTIGGQNEFIPSAAPNVQLATHGTCGRLLMTTDDVEPGKTLIVEDPFLSVLSRQTGWDVNQCAKCFTKLIKVLPCPNCVFTGYCSEECRRADYEDGHKYECGCLGLLHALQADASTHLCLKAVCKVGPKSIYKLFQEEILSKSVVTPITTECVESPTKSENVIVTGINPETGKYESNSYFQILLLKSHIVERDLPRVTFTVKAIASILEAQTDFFKDLKIEMSLKEKKDFFQFVASLILQHGLSFQYNTIGISGRQDMSKGCKSKVCRRDSGYNVTGIYALASLLNHSCNPNVFWETLPDGKMALISLRPIRAGEELEVSYGFDYWGHSLLSRGPTLEERYNFVCICKACLEDWSLFPEHSKFEKDMTWICNVCRAGDPGLSEEDISQKCVLEGVDGDAEELMCKNCGSISIKEEYIGPVFRECCDLLKSADAILKANRALDAIPRIVRTLAFFHNYCRAPIFQTIQAQEMLKEAFEIVVNWPKM